MLARIVSLAAGGGAAELRRLRARLVAGAIALAALLIAVGFALAALFLWLATRMEPWQAALLAALAALALAGIALLAGQSAARRRRLSEADLAAQMEAVMAQVSKEAEDKPMTAVATGLAAGVVLGRLLSR
jgi:formate hydrogenlyase subunit 3/multisubunit Na+/H+ antiporter MnhD subunit